MRAAVVISLGLLALGSGEAFAGGFLKGLAGRGIVRGGAAVARGSGSSSSSAASSSAAQKTYGADILTVDQLAACLKTASELDTASQSVDTSAAPFRPASPRSTPGGRSSRRRRRSSIGRARPPSIATTPRSIPLTSSSTRRRRSRPPSTTGCGRRTPRSTPTTASAPSVTTPTTSPPRARRRTFRSDGHCFRSMWRPRPP